MVSVVIYRALIRITKEEMESLMKLTEKYASNGYHVPAYMLAKLQSDKAFYYTGDSQIVSLNFENFVNFVVLCMHAYVCVCVYFIVNNTLHRH